MGTTSIQDHPLGTSQRHHPYCRPLEVIHTTPVSEVVKNKSNLKRTASHLPWGSYLGIDKDGHLGVETVEGQSLYFDVKTGKLAKSASSTSGNW